MTFETVEKQLARVNVEHVIATGKMENIYQIAKPILLLLSKFPLIPKKWRNILKALLMSLDANSEKTANKDLNETN